MELDILTKYCDGRLKIPSEKQSQKLYNLYERALSDGVVLE